MISPYAFDWHYQPHVPHSFDLRYGAAVSFSSLLFLHPLYVTLHQCHAIESAQLSHFKVGPSWLVQVANLLCQVGARCQLGFRSTMIGRRWL